MIFRIVKIAAAVLIASIGAAMALVAYPEPFFPYSRTVGNITFRANTPIGSKAAGILTRIDMQLKESPLASDIQDLSLYIAGDEGWRNRLYFALIPKAGGITYYPVSLRHAFLQKADFETGFLIKNGKTISPPRDLVYYGVHELSHVLMGRRFGVVRFYQMPFWVREGVPDYIALGSKDFAELGRFLESGPISNDDRKVFGSYPRKRMLVAWFLEHEGLTLDQLVQLDMDESDALKQMRAKG